MTPPLSFGTRRRLEALFEPADREEATRLLVERRGHNLSFPGDADALALERVRFAALKLSEGDLSRLNQAVELGETDWRDLLMAAGFGHDVRAHAAWFPDGG